MLIEQTFHIGEQPAEVGTEASRKNDRIEFESLAVVEYRAVGREAIDAATYPDGAVLDLVQRADVDQRHASVLLDHPARSLGGAAQSQLLDRTDGEAQDRRVDEIDQP